MMHRTTAQARSGRAAFTLIELMVVVAIVAILIGAVFQMMNVIGDLNRKAITEARLQRIQNAIGAYYAHYGFYPPVEAEEPKDPWSALEKEDAFGNKSEKGDTGRDAARCNRAAQSQPVAFEFPPAQQLDEYINRAFDEWELQSPNNGSIAGSAASPALSWRFPDTKFFRFGLLAHLLPKYMIMGRHGKDDKNQNDEPHKNFLLSQQWRHEDDPALQANEQEIVGKWLPNLERIVLGGRIIWNVDLHEPETEYPSFRTHEVRDKDGRLEDILGYESSGSQQYVLQTMTLRDGWGRELYYYSPPPHQSFRLWSAGPDGRTFPPWIPVNVIPQGDALRELAASVIKDDIIRFDQ